MINILYFFVLVLAITGTVYLVTPGKSGEGFQRAGWVFIQLVGSFMAIGLVVYFLTAR